MRNSKLIVSATVAISAIVGIGTASAADLPARTYSKAAPMMVDPAYNWSGWYVGVNAGYAWSNSTGSLGAFSPALGAAVGAGGTPALLGAKHEGGFGGGQVGYNWQMSNWLVGLEADIQGADIGKTSTVLFPGGGGVVPSTNTGRDHLNWFGTFRGRVGVIANNVLFYGTGGFAYGGLTTTATNFFVPAFNGVFAGSTSDTRFGWVAGAGIEWGFARNWTVKAEYLHIDLGNSNVTLTDPVNFPGLSSDYSFRHQLDTVRVGVNYLFGGPVVARY
jgi:outer membrane immunogenic protein